MDLPTILGVYSLGWLAVFGLSRVVDLSRWGLAVGPLYVEWSSRLPEWNLSGRFIKYILDFGIFLSIIFSFLGIYMIFSGLLSAAFLWGRAAPTIAPPVPGLTVRLDPPTILALAATLMAHELGHAIAASAEGIGTKRIAFFFLFILPGAYVELDEGDVAESRPRSRARVFSAGVLSNAIVAGSILMLGVLLMSGFPNNPSGIYVEATVEGGPSWGRLIPGDVITAVDGVRVTTTPELISVLSERCPGSTAVITTLRGDFEVILGSRPGGGNRSWLGVLLSPFGYYKPRIPMPAGLVVALSEFSLLSIIFNLSAAALNALPALPLDMGKIFEDALRRLLSNPKTAARIATISSIIIWSAVAFDLTYSLLWVARII